MLNPTNPTITNLTLVGPGSAPTTGTWLENDAMKQEETKGVLQTYSLVTGKWVSMLKMTRQLLYPYWP
jgi:hypothetical protein